MFFIKISFSQTIWFGYPPLNKIKIGAKIIINIPNHLDGKFIFGDSEEQLNALTTFLNTNSDFYFDIEINIFYGADNYCYAYGNLLCKNLEKVLLEKCNQNNYQLIVNGNSNPIYCNKEDRINYFQYNNRLEIIVTKVPSASPDVPSVPQ